MKPRSGRVIGVFGLPCTGKTTLIEVLKQSSKELTCRISSGDIARKLSTAQDMEHMAKGNLFADEDTLRGEILELINRRRAQGTEIIFLDGFPRTEDQIKWLLDNQLAGTIMEGCLVQVRSDMDNMLNRASKRQREQDDAVQKKIEEQQAQIFKMEHVIGMHSIPYFTVVNADIELAAMNFAKMIGLRR